MIVNISTKVSPKGADKISMKFLCALVLCVKLIILMITVVNDRYLNSQDSIMLGYLLCQRLLIS